MADSSVLQVGAASQSSLLFNSSSQRRFWMWEGSGEAFLFLGFLFLRKGESTRQPPLPRKTRDLWACELQFLSDSLCQVLSFLIWGRWNFTHLSCEDGLQRTASLQFSASAPLQHGIPYLFSSPLTVCLTLSNLQAGPLSTGIRDAKVVPAS